MGKTYYGKLQDPNKPVLLTNSMARVFGDCERKFVREYVARTEPDEDYKNPDYFGFGSALHGILDDIKHDHHKLTSEIFNRHVIEEGLDEIAAVKLGVVYRSYIVHHQNAGFTTLACDIRFKNDLTKGSVDIILAG
jgi:hypothetical protein